MIVSLNPIFWDIFFIGAHNFSSQPENSHHKRSGGWILKRNFSGRYKALFLLWKHREAFQQLIYWETTESQCRCSSTGTASAAQLNCGTGPWQALGQFKQLSSIQWFNVSLEAAIHFKKTRLDTFLVVGLYWTTQSLSNAEKTLISPVLLFESQVQAFFSSFFPPPQYYFAYLQLLFYLKRVLMYFCNYGITQIKE